MDNYNDNDNDNTIMDNNNYEAGGALSYGFMKATEMERAVLASLITDATVADEVFSKLTEADFAQSNHATTFSALKKLFQSERPLDMPSLIHILQERSQMDVHGFAEFIHELSFTYPETINIGDYIKVVYFYSTLRKLVKSCGHIVERCRTESDKSVHMEDFIDSVEKEILDITQQQNRSELVPMEDIVVGFLENLDSLWLNQTHEGITGLATKFSELDQITSGLQPTDLIIVAGRPAMGKTAFALSMGLNVAKEGKSVAVFSLEMSSGQLVQRLISTSAGVPASEIRSGKFKKETWTLIRNAANEFAELPFYIDDTPSITISELRSKARRLKARSGLDLIIIDYLQLMSGIGGDNREQEISQISRSLKALAKELELPIVALSQLNRDVEKRADKRPNPSDLRESGAIEQDADIIMFLYRDEVYTKEKCTKPGIAEVIISKHRNGPTGMVELLFESTYVRFKDKTPYQGSYNQGR